MATFVFLLEDKRKVLKPRDTGEVEVAESHSWDEPLGRLGIGGFLWGGEGYHGVEGA